MGHKYLVAAYCCTWAIQLGYLILLIGRWQAQRRRLGETAGKSPTGRFD